MGWGIGIGIGWGGSNASAGPLPEVYSFEIVNCGGPIATVYSTSEALAEGARIFTDPALTIPATSNLLGEPFNVVFPDPGFGTDLGGYLYDSIQSCE